jgi:orotate phosphoribosyltransferase
MFQGIREQTANAIIDRGAIEFGAFKLKLHDRNPKAPLSPFFISLRNKNHPTKPGKLEDADYELIARSMFAAIREDPDLVFMAIAGIPVAGDPIADAVESLILKDERYNQGDFRVIRLSKIESDKGRMIIPKPGFEYRKRELIILFDDLITEADTKLEAIRSIESQGGIVVAVVVLIDREQGGPEALAAAGHRLIAVFKISELFRYYHTIGKLDENKFRESMIYLGKSI